MAEQWWRSGGAMVEQRFTGDGAILEKWGAVVQQWKSSVEQCRTNGGTVVDQ